MKIWEAALLAAAVLAIFEVLTGAFVALSLALGCVAVALAELVMGRSSVAWDVAAFALTAGVAAVSLRGLFAHPGDSTAAPGDVNDY